MTILARLSSELAVASGPARRVPAAADALRVAFAEVADRSRAVADALRSIAPRPARPSPG